jgi:hypothetical protein
VGGRHTGATDAPLSTAVEAHERVSRHAAARQSVLARSVIATYARRIVDPPRLTFLSPATGSFTSDAMAPARFRTFGDTYATLLVWTKTWLRF